MLPQEQARIKSSFHTPVSLLMRTLLHLKAFEVCVPIHGVILSLVSMTTFEKNFRPLEVCDRNPLDIASGFC